MFLKTTWFTSLVPGTQSCKYVFLLKIHCPQLVSLVFSAMFPPRFPTHCNQGYLSKTRSDQVTLV